MNLRRTRSLALLCASVASLAACGGQKSTNEPTTSLTLMAYDGFVPQEGIFDLFTDDTGITVKVVTSGDTGTMLSKALLTVGNPEADVMWGVDNTFISRAVKGGLFESYEPVDFGDVCVNFDRQWFDQRGITAPSTFEQLADPVYKDLLVVENPATSSPGLAFLLGTIARFGNDEWADYWSRLRANGVKVVDDWTTAYTVEFSGSSGKGSRPLVVSYGSSPPAEVVYSDPPIDEPPTAAIADTCFRQVEYAGILSGTKHSQDARSLVEFLTSRTFQESMPLTLFVFPVNREAQLPEVFKRWAVVPDDPLTMQPDQIATNREDWITQWTDTVLR